MCLVVFAWKSHPDYRLILAANRDELHARPAEAAGWWPHAPDILAGRDLEAGGTWLGVHRSGRFATVTNYREQQQKVPGARSRGEIVTNFIASASDPLQFVASINGADYAGVSALCADHDQLCYASNRGDAAVSLTPGIYGLANASLDAPWTKLVRSKKALRDLIDADTVDRHSLLRLLADRTPAAAAEVISNDEPLELAQALTAPFIVADRYGTRCSTTVLIANDGRIDFFERRFDAQGNATGESGFDFNCQT